MLFFFNDTATTEIYTLSLHDALPIYHPQQERGRADGPRVLAGDDVERDVAPFGMGQQRLDGVLDRKSTRLNSSHANISYAVFCLKKKKISSEKKPANRAEPPISTHRH